MMLDRRAHEAGEQRVRQVWLTLELGMELASDEMRVPWELDHLDQAIIGRDAAQNEATLLELVAVRVVHLVAVAMALADLGGAVNLGRKAILA